MCGIVGMVMPGRVDKEAVERVKSALELLRHRGEEEQVVVSGAFVVGHTRLATYQLESNHQPRWCSKDEVLIAFNGQIYNYDKLGAHAGDEAATLANLISDRGEHAFGGLEGPFAIASYSRKRQEVLLARDRFGEKPLFYAHLDRTLYFSSELHALVKLVRVRPALKEQDVAAFLRLNFIPSPASGLTGVRQLRPGECLKFRHSQVYTSDFSANAPSLSSEHRNLRDILFDALQERVRGTGLHALALSSGIDSGILALLSRDLPSHRRPVAVTLSFPGTEFDEVADAEAVARRGNMDHMVVTSTPETLSAALCELIDSADIPLADPSIVGEFMMAKFCRERNIKVLLTGDGADELFMGYRYFGAARLIHHERMPYRILVQSMLKILAQFSDGKGDMSWPYVARMLKKAVHADPRIGFYQATGAFSWNDNLLSQWGCPSELLKEQNPGARSALDAVREGMLAHYLPDQITQRLDRSTMLAGVEARCPFLSLEVANFAMSHRAADLVSRSARKLPLSELFKELLQAREIKSKRGFRIPLRKMLSGPLGSVVREKLIDDYRLERFIPLRNVRALLREHNAGTRDHHKQVWALLVMNAWMKRNAIEMRPSI